MSTRDDDATLTDHEDGDEPMTARKVENSTFVWAIGLLAGVLVAVAGWCFNEISSLRADVAATEAKVQAYITSGNTTTQNVLLSLGKLQTDVEWIRRQLDAPARNGRNQQ